MRISVEARASAARDGARARVVIDEPPAAAAASVEGARGRIASIIATIVGIAGAVTSLPEFSERLSPRAVMALHFIAMVGTSAQPLIVALATAVIAAIAERRQNHGTRDLRKAAIAPRTERG